MAWSAEPCARGDAGHAGHPGAQPGRVTIQQAANGGRGRNGCPDDQGTDGGDGGDIVVNDDPAPSPGNPGPVGGGGGGREYDIKDSANGGDAGRSVTGKTFGGPKGDKDLNGKKIDVKNSFLKGLDAEGCPPDGLPVSTQDFGRSVGVDPSQLIKLVMRTGKLLRLNLRSPQLSLSLLLRNKTTGAETFFSVFDPDFPENPPFNAKGEVVVDPGRYCLFVFYSVGGVSFLANVLDFEVPASGTEMAQFESENGPAVQGQNGDGAIVIELSLTDCCNLGSLFEVGGTIDSPTSDFLVNSMQLTDLEQDIFGFALLDFPESPAAPLSILTGGSQGTYTSNLPNGTYQVTIRGNPTDARSRFLQRFPGGVTVNEGPAEGNFQLAQFFPLDVTVTADDFRSIFFRQAGVEVQSSNAQVSTLVPAGPLDVEVRRRIREEGTNFIVGELTWNPGQTQVSDSGLAGNSVDYTFPAGPPFVEVTILVQDELGNGIDNAIVSWGSGPLTEAADMSFFGGRRTEDDGFLTIPMPAGNYVFLVELPPQ